MLFNFVLAGITARRLGELDDMLRPLTYGLRAAGHRAVAFGRIFLPPPAINLIVNHANFTQPDAVRARARSEGGEDVRIGLLCAEDVDGMAARPELWAPLQDLARVADFIWTSAPTAAFGDALPASRVGVLGYGFQAELLGPRFLPQELRSAGVIVYGEETPRRAELAERLTAAKLPVYFVRPGYFPDYLVTDLLSRAALAVITRNHPLDRAPVVPRLLKAICNGAAVLAEVGPAGGFALSACGSLAPYDDLVERCRAALGRGDGAAAGKAALDGLRASGSMAAALAPAITVAARGGA